MSETFAVQLTAVATLALAILALATAVFAALAWRIQSRQLRDDLTERKREAEERRRGQAVQVYMWQVRSTHQEIGKPAVEMITAYVRNSSQQPIYEVRFGWGAAGSSLNETVRAIPLQPETQDTETMPVPKYSGLSTFGPVVTFRDRAGRWWRTRPDGQLYELPPRPTVIPPPMDELPSVRITPRGGESAP